MALNLVGPPTISLQGFTLIMRMSGYSTSVAEGCYEAILDYGLDPAIGLAFFQHESSYGKAGAARYTHNWGNIRAAGRWLDHHDGDNGTWLIYRPRVEESPGEEWIRSAADWAQLIRELYVERWELLTVEAALRRYAPTEDQNDPASYAACVRRSVATWAEQYPCEPAGPTLEERVEDVEDRVTVLESLGDKLRGWYETSTDDL